MFGKFPKGSRDKILEARTLRRALSGPGEGGEAGLPLFRQAGLEGVDYREDFRKTQFAILTIPRKNVGTDCCPRLGA